MFSSAIQIHRGVTRHPIHPPGSAPVHTPPPPPPPPPPSENNDIHNINVSDSAKPLHCCCFDCIAKENRATSLIVTEMFKLVQYIIFISLFTKFGYSSEAVWTGFLLLCMKVGYCACTLPPPPHESRVCYF